MKNQISIKGVRNATYQWKNSASVLCNYMRERSYLEMILKNSAIIPRYYMEHIEYLGLPDRPVIAYPMTCFCDIPFGKVGTHMKTYGRFGIGLKKESCIKNNGLQPVHYVNESSPYFKDFKQAFLNHYPPKTRLPEEQECLVDFLLTTLVYMKPIRGFMNRDGKAKGYMFQDEWEWRFIPPVAGTRELPLLLPRKYTTQTACNAYSAVLRNHEEYWLRFETADIRYLIVPNEDEAQKLIEFIMGLERSEAERYRLISKIEIAQQFEEDLI